MREYTGVLIITIPLAIGYYLLFKKEESLKKVIWQLTLYCLPFAISDGIWATRNYLATGKIILITTPEQYAYDKLYSPSWEALDNLVYTWGENALPSNTDALGYYYRQPWEKISYPFPKNIFNGITTYNADSLVMLRSIYKEYLLENDSAKTKALEQAILSRCSRYRQDYISHNGFAYWVIKPFKDIKYLIFFSGTGYLPLPRYAECNLLEKSIKVIFALLYYTILIGAFGGILKYFFVRRNIFFLPSILFIGFITIVGSMIFIGELTVYCSSQEPRYFVQSFALLLPFASLAMTKKS